MRQFSGSEAVEPADGSGCFLLLGAGGPEAPAHSLSAAPAGSRTSCSEEGKLKEESSGIWSQRWTVPGSSPAVKGH